jgi:hypothetical protein
MMQRRFTRVIAVALAAITVSACQTPSDPARNVEAYLTAKVNRDADTVRRLLCAEREMDYELEVTTFEGVTNARIEGMRCIRDGNTDIVRCQGKIVADYGTEKNEFPLTAYRVTQEGGEWKWCGETE